VNKIRAGKLSVSKLRSCGRRNRARRGEDPSNRGMVYNGREHGCPKRKSRGLGDGYKQNILGTKRTKLSSKCGKQTHDTWGRKETAFMEDIRD